MGKRKLKPVPSYKRIDARYFELRGVYQKKKDAEAKAKSWRGTQRRSKKMGTNYHARIVKTKDGRYAVYGEREGAAYRPLAHSTSSGRLRKDAPHQRGYPAFPKKKKKKKRK